MSYGFSFNPDQSQQLVSLTWGGLVGQTYAPLFTDGWIWGVQKISGWWSPSPNSTREVDAPSGDGKLALDPRLGVRPVTIEGFVRVEDRRATGILEQALDSLAAVRSDVLVVRELKRAVAREADCRLMDMQVTKVSDRLAKVTLSLQADDPLRYSSGVSSVVLSRNFYGNPSFESAAPGSTVVSTNLATNPRLRSTAATNNLTRPLVVEAGSFNLLFQGQHSSIPTRMWGVRAPIIADYISGSGVGLVGVQENSQQGTGHSSASDVAGILGGQWASYDVVDGGYLGFIYDQARYRMVTVPVVVDLPTDLADMDRKLLYALFEHVHSAQKFTFATTHLADPSWSGAYRQEAAILVAQTLRAVHSRTRLPVVLTGDLNSETSLVGNPRAFLAQAGFQDCNKAPTQLNPGVKSHNNWKPGGGSISLDYVGALGMDLVSGGVFVDFANGSTMPARTPLPSDHFLLTGKAQVATSQRPTRFGGGGMMTIAGNGSAYQDWSWPGPDQDGESQASVVVRPNSGGTTTGSGVYLNGTTTSLGGLGLQAGKTYGFGGTVRLTAPQVGPLAAGSARRIRVTVKRPSGNMDFDSTQAPNEAGEHRVVGAVTIPADTTGVDIVAFNGSAGPAELVWWSRFTLVEASTEALALELAGGYFSGGTLNRGDFAYQWAGSTDDSVTEKVAPRLLAGVDRVIDGHDGARVYQSSEWAASGEHSLCIDPITATGTWTRANPAAWFDVNERLRLIPGRTYTVSAVLHLGEPQAGSISNPARRIAVNILRDSTWTDHEFLSAQSPNEAGDHQVSLTFTYPSGAANLRILLYNGSNQTRVWWDDLILTEGSDPTYADGDSDGWQWDGKPNQSTSSTWEITVPESPSELGMRLRSGYNYLPNRGDATAYPIVTLIGPMSTPTFLSEHGGEFAVNRDLTDGEIVTVDLRHGDVWKDNARIWGPTLHPAPKVPPGGSRWWVKNPGAGQIWINRFEAWT